MALFKKEIEKQIFTFEDWPLIEILKYSNFKICVNPLGTRVKRASCSEIEYNSFRQG
jgi:hypothetical protein